MNFYFIKIILKVSTTQDYHRDRKCRSGVQRRKSLKEEEIESHLFKFLKTGNSDSELSMTHIKTAKRTLQIFSEQRFHY